MNEGLPIEQKKLKGKAVLVILSIAAVVFYFSHQLLVVLLNVFTNGQYSVSEIVTSFLFLISLLLFALYTLVFHKTKAGNVVAPLILAPVLLSNIINLITSIGTYFAVSQYYYSSIEGAFEYFPYDFFYSLYIVLRAVCLTLRPFALCALVIGIILLIIGAIIKFRSKLLTTIGAILVVMFLAFSVLNCLNTFSLSIYAIYNGSTYSLFNIFISLLSFATNFTFYFGFILMALLNGKPKNKHKTDINSEVQI